MHTWISVCSTHYTGLFPEWAIPNHVIMHVQFSSGITIFVTILTRNFTG